MPELTTQDQGAAPNMAALGQEFRGASDATLRKVTRLIDRMPDRGEADALLAPVRDRLAALRPVRNMNRNRLLFTPFDQVLVRPAHWQSGSACLPRSVLGPVITLLDKSVSLPPTPVFDAADPAELLRCGRPLWEAAAAALDGATVPADWCSAGWELANGLSGATLGELLPVMAMVFRSAHAIRTLPEPRDPALEPALLSLLAMSARRGPVGWGIMLVLLLDAAPADLVTRLAGTIGRGDRMATVLRTGIDQAVTQMLVRLEQAARPCPDAVRADEPTLLLQRLDTMQRVAGLRDMENRPGFEQKRLARLEQTLHDASQAMFGRSLRSQLDRFAATTAGQDGADRGDDARSVLAMEADARRLRLFAAGAATMEGGRVYQTMIDTAIADLNGAPTVSSPVGRLRLVELLAGSERAVQMAMSMRAPS